VSEYLDPVDSEIQVVMERNYRQLENENYQLIKIPTRRKNNINYSYTNSVIVGKTAYVPQYGLSTDVEALASYTNAGFLSVAIAAENLIRLHGGLHCLTTYRFQ
jgi:agmatine/peptidylarginine deiminase